MSCALGTHAQLTVQVGTDSDEMDAAPVNTCNGFNYTQIIYTADQLATAGIPTTGVTISKIKFNIKDLAGSTETWNVWKVYMAHTTETEFDEDYVWIDPASFTEVFDGNIGTDSEGWFELELATPFVWNGTDNLAIAVSENVEDGWCTTFFEATDVDDRQVMNFGHWEEIDPLDPGSGEEWEVQRVSVIPNIKFVVTPTDACSGTADAGTASAPESICALHPFNVSVTGSSLGTGLTAQWQSAASATGPWTNIAGATATEYANMDGIAVPTFYRYYVHCAGSGTSDTSNVVEVTLNPFMECYCEPVPDDCGAVINDVSTTGGINNISNLGTGCEDGGYSNYTDQFIEAAQGTIFNYEVVLDEDTWWSGIVRIWIDWNQDGSFSDTEMLYASEDWEGPGTVITGSYEVPFTAVGGDTRMRIRVYDAMEYGACDDDFMGETEDYKFTVVVPDPCDEVDFTEVSISGPEDICSFIPFTVISEGTPVASGIDRIWQSRTPSGTGDWVTMAGEESLNYTSAAGISEPTDYRYIISCPASGDSDTSNVITVGIRPGTECYCTPIYEGGCSWVAITHFELETIDNNTEDECSVDPPGYSDYHAMSTDLMQGVTYAANVTASGEADLGYVIWIDYNDDGFFDNTTERVATVGMLPGTISDEPYGITLPIPSDAALGAHRLRIRTVAGTSGYDIDPCAEYWDGEAEDYTVNIIPQPSCEDVAFPGSVAATALPGQLCSEGNVILNLDTAMPVALGITYQWFSSASETGTFMPVGTPAPTPLLVHAVSATSYFKCVILCEGTTALTSETVAVPVITPGLLGTTPSSNCGPGEVTLGANGNDGSIIRWYAVPDGGYPVSEGTSYTTPFLTATTQYYVTAAAGSGPALDTLVRGTSSVSSWNFVTPYYHEDGGAYKHQYLIRGSELTALGIQPGDLTALTFIASGGGSTYNDFSLKIASTAVNEMTASFIDEAFTDVYSAASVTTASGPNTYTFSTPFAWDGMSNIVVQVCWSNGDDWGTTTNVRYHNTTFPAHFCGWSSDADADDVCTEPENLAWEVQFQRPNMIFSSFSGCESERVAVTATINPVPVAPFVATDSTACGDLDQSLTLNAGNPGSNYLWNTGDVTQTLKVTESGPYSVTVTNEFDCSVTDLININLLPKPVVFLGNDTSICEGGSLVLNAANPDAEYYWSNGETSQSITIIAGGTYRVLVTNSSGCMTGDTINVSVSGIIPTIESIIVNNIDAYTFTFSPLNPENITTYSWDFGDGSPVSNAESPTHTYASNGNYTITLTLTNDCGSFVYTTSASIVGLNTIVIDNDILTLYPNPAKETAVIENKGDLKMKEVTVMNILGQVLSNEKAEGNKHQLYLSGYASGIYTVRILTDKGYVVRKFEIVK